MQIIILTLPGRHLFRKRNKNKGVTHEVSRSKYLLSFARTRPSQPKRLLRRSRLPRPLGRESSAFAKGYGATGRPSPKAMESCAIHYEDAPLFSILRSSTATDTVGHSLWRRTRTGERRGFTFDIFRDQIFPFATIASSPKN